MEFTPLSELQIGQRGSTIRCRIARIWDSTNHALKDELISLDSLLVDDQGTSIQASIRKVDAPRMRELIVEGRVYTIANFIVASARNSYKVCTCDKTLYIGTWTIIRENTDTTPTIPPNSFNFAEFSTLGSRVYNDIILTDIIGQIMSVGKQKMTYTNGRMVGRKNIIINIIGKGNVSVTLWGAIAHKFNEMTAVELGKNDPVIAVFAAMTVRTFQGDITLSSTNATKIYLGLAIPEMDEFRSRMSCTGKITDANAHTTLMTAMIDDMPPEAKKIEELLALNPYLDKGKKYTCKATVAYIDASRGWFYNACGKCQAGVTNYDGLFACNRCGPITTLPVPWYKITMMVTDATGGAKFVMIGKQFEKIVKMSAAELCETSGTKKTILPPILNELRGRDFIFTVAMDDKDDDPTTVAFKVYEIMTEQSTMQIVGNNKRTFEGTSSATSANTQNSKSRIVENIEKTNEFTLEEGTAKQKGKKPREAREEEEFTLNEQPKFPGEKTCT